MMNKNDITAVYYTANRLPVVFAKRIRAHLRRQAEQLEIPVISVSQEPVNLGLNIVHHDTEHSVWNLYTQVLAGVELADTPYVAMCEDDCLYSPVHFLTHRPRDTELAFNLNRWSVRAWDKKPIFSWKDRTVFSQLIARTASLKRALEERLALRYLQRTKEEEFSVIQRLGEPGRYEEWLGITPRTKETFESTLPNVVFDHLYGLQGMYLAKRKKLGTKRQSALEFWGGAEQLIKDFWGEEVWIEQQEKSY